MTLLIQPAKLGLLSFLGCSCLLSCSPGLSEHEGERFPVATATAFVSPSLPASTAGVTGLPSAPTLATATNSIPSPLLNAVDELRTTRRATFAAPVTGGSLFVTREGMAVAADADREAVFLVDLVSREVRSITLELGDEPGRGSDGPPGLVFVLARRGGDLLVIDTAQGVLEQRVPVCNAPRGIAYDSMSNLVHVACRSGRLVTLDAVTLQPTRTLQLDADLRDVLVVGSDLVVTRFRSAEVLVIASDGSLKERASLGSAATSEATVAYRAVVAPNGVVYVAHQSVGAAYYTTQQVLSGGYSKLTLASPVTMPDAPNSPPGMSIEAGSAGLAGPLDLAVDEGSGRVAVLRLSTTIADQTKPALDLQLASNSQLEGAPRASSFPVAVAFDTTGHWVIQSREPAQLELEDGSVIPLSDESHADTGVALFHVDLGGGVSCASCHPEAGDDGHVWNVALKNGQNSQRRTQPLEGGVLGRAPFHWAGELKDMKALVYDAATRGGAARFLPSDVQVEALGEWLNNVPPSMPAEGLDSESIALGNTHFHDNSLGCSGCHAGTQLTDNLTHDVGTGESLSTPTLLGVGLREPLFHDGCMARLKLPFGACAGGTEHSRVAELPLPQQAALEAYLRSL